MSRLFKSFLTFIALGMLLGCSFPGDDINLPFFGPQASASPAVSATPEGGGANLAGTVAPAEPSATPTVTATPVPPAVNAALLNLPTITTTPNPDAIDMLMRN